ncbi:NAD-dependent epimerase/dehydratase family protein [Bacillus timonensis]|uniref:NAD-dependent epimerase/dehydratase family protein n=1 Tax=Bacillus timonensis TaxID=1033734 RepID=UPI0002885091|nr:NAD-dependent epimerase/dehydratase family protein [Bacillus timonensis]
MLDVNNELYQEDLKHAASYINIPNDKDDVSVLITGASGLIGSFLVDTFVYYNRNHNRKIKIYGMSRRNVKLNERFNYRTKDDNLELIAHDICDPLDNSTNFTFIIHAASNADPKSYSLYPVDTIKTNILGITNVLEYAKKHKDTRVLFTSTMEVYGDIKGSVGHNENEYGLIDFNNIRSGYPEGKRISELLCRSYSKQYGVNSVIARLGYIYGPTMTTDDSKVIAQFIRKAICNEDIILKSKGEQRRSYCYLSDTIAGLMCVLFKGKSGEAYNIANRNSTVTIKDIAELIVKQTKKNIIFDMPDEVEKAGYSRLQDAVLDEAKLMKLGWKPQFDMVSGLQRTISILGGYRDNVRTAKGKSM